MRSSAVAAANRAQLLKLALFALKVSLVAAEPEEYGARVDPWVKEWTEAIRIAEDQIVVLRLHRGELAAMTPDGGAALDLTDEEQQSLMGAFPKAARTRPVEDAVWAAKVRLHGMGADEHAACPVNGENHLEHAVVEVFDLLRGSPHHRMLNIGGLYGGKDGSASDQPDDPTVELLRHAPEARVLCWNCGDVSRVTRLDGLSGRVRVELVDVMDQEVVVPLEFRELDLLRLDFVPGGQSCYLLKKLLRGGVRPRLVAMLVLSQVPPPFKYAPLPADIASHPEALFSCSLAAAAEVASAYDLFLVRLTGPYALFAQRSEWEGSLPISELDCFRGASVWGHQAVPIEFVRDWLFSPVAAALPFVWGNLTAIYEAAGNARAPFTLAV